MRANLALPALARCLFGPMLLVLGPLGPAGAQDRACMADVAESVECIGGRLCTCRFEPGSQATRQPDGFRWDCGILQPHCGGEVPATIDAWQGQLPDGLSIDQSRTILKQVTGKEPYRPRH